MYIFQPDRYLLEKQIQDVSNYISGKVLDVGAGEVNRYAKYFAYTEYIRMDPRHTGKADLVGSADNIPLPDDSVDSIVCTQVFEHLSDPWKSAQELFRVLKPKGYALITVPQMNELHEEPFDFYRYTKFGLQSMFEKAGFTVVRVDQRGGLFSMLWQICIRYCIDRFSLYQRPYVGKVFGYASTLFGKLSMFLDRFDGSVANKKHTIGWCIIIQK